VRLLGVRLVLAKLQVKIATKNVDFVQKYEISLFNPKRVVFWPKQQKYRSKHRKRYLVELVRKFSIDWHLNLENLIFVQFLLN